MLPMSLAIWLSWAKRVQSWLSWAMRPQKLIPKLTQLLQDDSVVAVDMRVRDAAVKALDTWKCSGIVCARDSQAAAAPKLQQLSGRSCIGLAISAKKPPKLSCPACWRHCKLRSGTFAGPLPALVACWARWQLHLCHGYANLPNMIPSRRFALWLHKA